MKVRVAALWLLLSLFVAAPAIAEPDVMPLVRADRWTEALGAAAEYPDPVVAKLVTYYRLLAPNSATAGEIAAFMAVNPDWPAQAMLVRRRDEALVTEPDDGVARAECGRAAPQSAASLLRCADAFARGGEATQSARMARLAWSSGGLDAAGEQRFLHDYGTVLTQADQLARFDRLILADPPAAERQAGRLDIGDRAMAQTRLALRRDDPAAARLLAALSERQRANSGIFLDQAAWLRRAGQDEAARDLWVAKGAAAEREAGAGRESAFWAERNILARRLLRQGNAAGAYAVAAGFTGTGGEAAIDSAFLAGFVALRPLADPTLAEPHFRRLAGLSLAAITQGRAHYWLGRTATQRGDTARAQTEFAEAAKFPNTFYGQLGALRAGATSSTLAARISATTDPPVDAGRAIDFAGRELARATAYLVGWGEARRAQAFLLRLDDIAPDPADRALAARLAAGLGMPETAVALARRAGRDGIILLATGWPQPVSPPAPPEPALSLAIMRQESSFDTGIISPAGARGLMQLMPATAGQVARTLGIAASVPALVLDPIYNMRLGTTYLAELLNSFAGSVPMAAAAYNAGPNRVNEWIGMNGDPRTPNVDVLDWIELIPFSETRNYVQRVIENQVVYRALRGETRAHPLAQWLR